LSFLTHLASHAVGTWGYYAVFGMLALEGLGLFFIPGEATLIAASILTGATHQLAIGVVLAAGWAGALVGDNGSFLLGRRFGFGLIRRYGPHVRINEQRVKFVQFLYLRYGTPIVFAGRFITLLRCWQAFLAGANGMAWRRFSPVNAVSSLVWVGLWGFGAYQLGRSSEPVLKAVGFAGLIVVCVVAPLGWRYFRRHEPALHERAERALPGPLRARGPADVIAVH
jgi:membrane protein DedA with SNARE-associated domain